MKENLILRRVVLAAGAGAMATAMGPSKIASALADGAFSPQNLETVQKYYAAWEQKDWHPFDLLLADDFTFTSANNDDHISKSAFKERCWKSQVNFIKRFDLKHVIGSGDDAFVLYIGQTSNDKAFRNVEYLKLRNGKVRSIECYFGAQASFASSVSTGQQ
jgi:ketosteroid isomerase-like protein